MNGLSHTEKDARAVAYWLLLCCALVFIMVLLGGVTRLTGSGLSMVEWKPVYGILPPLSEQDWQTLFTKYQQSPEYLHINNHLDLDGFKDIFWLEYLHRMLGRIIGIVFLLPLLFFWLTKQIPAGLMSKLVAMFCIGGLQGLLGWYMVKSGLVDNPHVSQYRLTAHLLLAILIYGFMFWVALDLLFVRRERYSSQQRLAKFGAGLLGMTVLTIASGGFVAGLKAGLAYNTFPLMAGQWLPEGLWRMQPWYTNLFENITTVQFDHRLLATITFFSILLFWLAARRYPLTRTAALACHVLMAVVLLQIGLGISTLLLQVPIGLASVHQAGALILFSTALFLTHRLCYPEPQAYPLPPMAGQVA